MVICNYGEDKCVRRICSSIKWYDNYDLYIVGLPTYDKYVCVYGCAITLY